MPIRQPFDIEYIQPAQTKSRGAVYARTFQGEEDLHETLLAP